MKQACSILWVKYLNGYFVHILTGFWKAHLRVGFLILIISLSFFAEGRKEQNVGAKRRRQMMAFIQLKRAIKQSSRGDYASSTKALFHLMSNPALSQQKDKIRYYLALSLYNMGLYYPSIVQFQTLVADGSPKYKGKSLRKIALAAAYLKNDQLLNYSISHSSLQHIAKKNRDQLHYQFGEYWMRKKKFRRAMAHFSRIKSSRNSLFYKSLYQLGLIYAELNQVDQAVQIFSKLESRRRGVTDSFRVAALMGKARSYYQGKKWEESVESYHMVPKDSVFWHDTLLEKSWALVRAGKLRSALSNFHTLHSSYYEDYYQPESLLLRAIIYIYICKHIEMEKVLDLFNRSYRPVYSQVNKIISRKSSSNIYYQALLLSADEQKRRHTIQYPVSVARRTLREGNVSAVHHYIVKLKQERDLIHGLPYSWKRSRIGRYSQKLIKRKLNQAQKKAGRMIIGHLKSIREELKGFFIQEQYLRYEMLKSKRRFLKEKIANKNLKYKSIVDFDRSFYIQNGYEYWTFQGEYWLDELGNYHYIGTESCKRKSKTKK